MRAGRIPFFVILLPVFFVLRGYVQHYQLVNAGDSMLLAGKYILAGLVICIISWLLFRDIIKAALFTFLLMAWNFFFGPSHDFLIKIFGNSFITRYAFILLLSLALMITAFILLRRTGKKFRKLTTYLNLLFVLLIVIEIINYSIKPRRGTISDTGKENFTISKCDSCPRYDIYMVIADEYAGSGQLKEDFGFDNSPFENELRKRGFHVIPGTRSNYNSTPFSVASLLSMQYIDSLAGSFTEKDLQNAYSIINQNTLTSWLKREGYEIKNHSVFRFGGLNTVSSTGFVASGTGLFTIHSFFGRFDRDLRFNLITRLKWRSEIKNFVNGKARENDRLIEETIETAGETSSRPRFIYLHTMMPHFPYLFDSDGNPDYKKSFEPENRFNKEAYTEYLQYSNRRFLDLFDRIRSGSKNAVIIFMGDHGFRHIEPLVKERHFKTFSAVYLPGEDPQKYAGFYDSLSLVNMFRVYLDHGRGNIPLLKDSTVFIENWW